MQCDRCGNKESVVHLTQIEGNQMTTRHLCEDCAAAKGVDPGGALEVTPLADFLAQIANKTGEVELPTGECLACGLTSAEFKRRGRVGCEQCYVYFGSQLRPLLRKLHGGVRHRGKPYLRPDPASPSPSKSDRVGDLRRNLERAVHAEDFERAAALRDQIRGMEARDE